MDGKILLFGFEDLPAILAVSAAAEPFGAEAVPVARGITAGPSPLWRGWRAAWGSPMPAGPWGDG